MYPSEQEIKDRLDHDLNAEVMSDEGRVAQGLLLQNGWMDGWI